MGNSVSYEFLMQEVAKLQNQIDTIELGITQSPPFYVNSVDPAFNGCGVGVIQTGSTYNLWGTGSFVNSVSFSGGNTYYLVQTGRADFIEALSYYTGPSTITTLWLTSGNNNISVPLNIDETGIWLNLHNNVQNITGSFNFTQTLMLNSKY